MSSLRISLFGLLALALIASASGKAGAPISRNPYLGAIAIDGTTGKVLFEENADGVGYPASTTKLMTFLVVMEKIKTGALSLETPITVDADTARIGGTQVWLKEKEVFPVDELLYAMMIQSANDAAYALAKQVGGSPEGFVEMMNVEARKIGMAHTTFRSPHGLPPSKGQEHDVTTARDMATLGAELIRRGDIIRYSSVIKRTFRTGSPAQIDMINHDHLLGSINGCDGLKTGYFYEAGFSIVVSVKRGTNRVIVVILGSPDKKVRDKKAKEIVEKAFAQLPATPVAPPAAPTVKIPSGETPKSNPSPATDTPPPVKFTMPGKK